MNLFTVVMTVMVIGVLWGMVCTAPGIPWNGARLASSFAIARGLPLYALRDTGAHLGWVYGPVYPLWYLPFAITDNPTLGLMLAAVWNAVTILLPVWLVARVVTAGSRRITGFVTVVGGILLLANPITRNAFLFIHVDAVSIAWAIGACVSLHAAAVRGWGPGLPIAAIAVALSVAAKQVSVVLVPATFMWLWWEGHGRLMLRWIFWLAVICGGLAALFFVFFGAEGMLFNAWLLFSRMPWQGGWDILWRNLLEVAWSSWLWLLGALLGFGIMRLGGRIQVRPEAMALVRLLGCLALWQLPLGFTAAMVVDAALNSIHALTYLLLAGLAWVAASQVANHGAGPLTAVRLAQLMTATAVVGLGATIPPMLDPGIVWTPYRGQEELVALARRHQGKIYLPWNPLTTVITERKIYPFDKALYYLWLSRLEPPREAVVAAVPAGALIIYQEPSQSHFALRYFGREARSEENVAPPGAPPSPAAEKD